MLRECRDKLRKIPLLHNSYLRLKRSFGSELVGMTTRSEQKYLAEYGEKNYTGRGEIVDLGCWLGSTTIPIAKGLYKNPAFAKSRRKVHAYDLFIWFDWMNSSVAGTELAGKFAEGDDFSDEFRRRIGSFSHLTEIHLGDLNEIGWNGGGIEFLLVDAMKGWDLANAIVRDFYPSLIPNHGLVFHQDFAHYFTPWIHLIQWKLSDHFEFVEEIPHSQSVVFRCIKAISKSEDLSFEYFDDNDVDEAFDYSMGFVSDEKLPNIAAAKVMWYLHQQKRDKAGSVFNTLAKTIPLKKDMLVVQELILAT